MALIGVIIFQPWKNLPKSNILAAPVGRVVANGCW